MIDKLQFFSNIHVEKRKKFDLLFPEMQALLYFTACLTFVDSKRFVLLDPDDPNLEKSASNITVSYYCTKKIRELIRIMMFDQDPLKWRSFGNG